jgi:hypothetical protein
MFYWLFLLALLAVAWRLSQPELARWLPSGARRLLGGLKRASGEWSGSLTPPHAPLKLYESQADLAPLEHLAAPHAELATQVEQWAARVALRASLRAPAMSPRLTVAAALVCDLAERGQRELRAADLRFICEHLGLAGEPPAVTLRAVDPSAPAAMIPALIEEAIAAAVALDAPRVELGVASLIAPSGARWVALLARGVRCLTAPVPKQLMGEVGAQGSGELWVQAPLTLWVTDPAGHTRRAPLTQRGLSFSWSLTQLTRGPHLVELTAQGAAGPEVTLRFTLYQDIKPPTEHALRALTRPRWAWPNALTLRARLQGARRALGRRPLDLSRPLNALAADLLAEASRAQGDTPLTAAGARARLSPAHAASLAALERLSGVDLDDLAEQLLTSPRRRALLLDPNITHIGLSVRRDPTGHLDALCLLAAQSERLSPARDLAEAYRVIQAHRRARGAGRLPRDPLIEEIADAVARAIAGGGCRPHEAAHHAAHLLQARGAPEELIASLDVQAYPLRRAANLPAQEGWLEEPVGVGVGLAQSTPSAPIWAVVALRLRPRVTFGDLRRIQSQLDEGRALAQERARPQRPARPEGRGDDLWLDAED